MRARLYEKAAPVLKEVVTGDAPGEIFGLPIRQSKGAGGRGPTSAPKPSEQTVQRSNGSTVQRSNGSTAQGGAQ